MSGQPRLRPAGPADDTAIRRLLAAAYPDNPKADAAFTAWQYWDNPFGPAVSWVWERDGTVLAHWAAVAVPLLLAGRPAIGAKGVDVATDPAERGRGRWRALAARLVAGLADAGVPALLSHPNPASHAGMVAAGMAEVARLPVFALPVDDGWLAARLHVPSALARGVRRAAFRAPAKVDLRGDLPAGDLDGLWDTVAASSPWGIRRDAAWWRWRYVARPASAAAPYTFHVARHDGRLRGAAVTVPREAFGGRFLYVLELLAGDAAAARALTGSMRLAAQEHGAAGLILASTPWGRAAALAGHAGFRRVPRVLEPRPLRFLVGAPTGDAAVLARQRWTMAWGDLDHL